MSLATPSRGKPQSIGRSSRRQHHTTAFHVNTCPLHKLVLTPISLMPTPNNPFSFDNDADDGEGDWQEMPIVKEDDFVSGLDEEDQRKYHYVPKKAVSHAHTHSGGNATGNLIDVDGQGTQWRSKTEQDENEYTRLRGDEEEDADEVHLRTRYLFNEDTAMTPLGQMQATKKMLTEAQRIAYVGLCALTAKEMMEKQKNARRKEFKDSIHSVELWALKVMGRLYYHMDLEIAGILSVILTLSLLDERYTLTYIHRAEDDRQPCAAWCTS